jgi:hypothetical protein
LIPGYEETLSGLVDFGEVSYEDGALLDDVAFWAAYYRSQSVDDDDAIADAFGLDVAAIRGMQSRLTASDRWPVFQVGLPDGARIAVVYRNLEEDYGVDYLVIPDGAAAIRIAALEGEYQGPGISWRELVSVSRSAIFGGWPGQILLLLAPMLGDAAATDAKSIGVIAEALTSVGAVGRTHVLAELIAKDNILWAPADWETREDGLAVCDAESSPRNPSGPVSLSPDELRIVSDILNT